MDKQNIDKVMKEVNEDVSYINDIVINTVSEYSSDVDRIMSEININILSDNCPPIMTIEKYFIELSSCLYFMCEKVERLGMFDSISKSKAQESYNSKYIEYLHKETGKVGAKKPTVAETESVAESSSLYDRTVNDIYNKSYKIMKSKISAAETMVNTLSKVLSHRMQESQMTVSQAERQLLNEESVF